MATETSVEIDPVADQAREELAQLEIEIDNVEKELVKQQNKLLKPIWEKRKAILTKIKDFWPVAVGNHPILSSLMNYEDSEVINGYLESIHVEKNDDNPENYRITMTFKQSKDGQVVASKTVINWHDGKVTIILILTALLTDLTKKRKSKDSEGENASFFDWFGDEDPSLGEVIRHVILILYYNGNEEDDENYEVDEEFDLDDTDEEEEAGFHNVFY
ncbi:hypothetical protein BC937DRAFT_93759 [Endogone sp. FLAS-F59071]|nr:hypothetical protein BC937DRAFT_93759 [Endogone sp. FLAS-F59071]|eukprot:RUS21051.1 hypothetical protein BC937DRAFT_93759 [Endogone sp. FLAS-F59071]